jgi:hypothetical protein
MGTSIALVAIVGLLAAGKVSAQAPAPRVFSVTGVIDGTDPNTKTVVDIVVAVPVGQDDQTAANAALKAVGARAPEPRDFPLALQPFVLDGAEWPQFFDKNKRNNVVTFLYNPTGDPTGGGALAAIQNAEATWSIELQPCVRRPDHPWTRFRPHQYHLLVPLGFLDLVWPLRQ